MEGLENVGISYWYDEAEIQWGDSITQKVNEGLRISRYVVVVLSSNFTSKNWPQRELNAVLNMESSSGAVRILPLLVGTEDEKADIIAQYPLLNDKKYLPWNNNIDEIVNAIQARLAKSTPVENSGTQQATDFKVPLPKIKRKFTQRDKDVFLKDSFTWMKTYFQKALSKLENEYREIETELTEIHTFKFICKIYLQGERVKQCKIWLGGMFSADSISYHEGEIDINNDSTMNDCLTLMGEEGILGFEPSNMWLTGRDYSQQSSLSKEQAAEYFWSRLTHSIQ